LLGTYFQVTSKRVFTARPSTAQPFIVDGPYHMYSSTCVIHTPMQLAAIWCDIHQR
jgi:hypothetical protein